MRGTFAVDHLILGTDDLDAAAVAHPHMLHLILDRSQIDIDQDDAVTPRGPFAGNDPAERNGRIRIPVPVQIVGDPDGAAAIFGNLLEPVLVAVVFARQQAGTRRNDRTVGFQHLDRSDVRIRKHIRLQNFIQPVGKPRIFRRIVFLLKQIQDRLLHRFIHQHLH
ncbi:hypothetical protein J21TS3_05150 [Paenibacillus cookii]|uniref:Uncharacterized protein n=1 Tax=Paenibacillus cookii TaxID=157839 RepID=A0ABQ4LR27_9BACL|nr:hypothetical protein J21TS3_05150 [Paenibacillus cookii]